MKYPRHLLWQKRVLVKNPGSGEEREEFVNNGKLWCRVEQVSGTTESVFESDQTARTCEVKVNDHPAITALDRLYDQSNDRTYVISEAYEAARETVCQCTVYDALQL